MMSRIVTLVAALCLSLCLFSGFGFALAADTVEPVVLTVIGDVANSNRGPVDEFADALFSANSIEFDKAHAFTRAELAALPQKSVTANAEEWPGPVKLSGPSLADVMAAAGVTSANLGFTALDGYEIEFDPGEMAAHDWVLAIDQDGKPLSIGGRGPVWLVYDTAEGKATGDQEARWVYSIFAIAAR